MNCLCSLDQAPACRAVVTKAMPVLAGGGRVFLRWLASNGPRVQLRSKYGPNYVPLPSSTWSRPACLISLIDG